MENGHCEKCKLHFYHHPVEPCVPGQITPSPPRAYDENLLDDEDRELIG